MRSILGIVLLATGVATGEPELIKIDRATARRLGNVARQAERAKQYETAARIYERVLQLDPDHRTARARLRDIPSRRDTSWSMGARFRGMRLAEETRRADAVLAAGITNHYVALLDYSPRHAGIHQALGHERVAGTYVRPELAGAARRLPELLARWRGLVDDGAPVFESSSTVELPGSGRSVASYRADDSVVAGTLDRSEMVGIVRSIPTARLFLRDVFGGQEPVWRSESAFFLHTDEYLGLVDSMLPPGAERDAQRRKGTFVLPRGVAYWTDHAEYARDLHAHAVCFWTIQQWLAPDDATSDDGIRQPWFAEGVAYLATFALFDTAQSWFLSSRESSSKSTLGPMLPDSRDSRSCIAWLQDRLLSDAGHGLRNVMGRTINSMDYEASLQSWSFLRFLAAYDPDAFRALPFALRDQEGASRAERAERALRRVFDKGLPELESLWRTFLLEVE